VKTSTSGIELLSLPEDTILNIGSEVKIKITGLRNPCSQLDNYQQGLMNAVLDRDTNGTLIRKAGVMAIVLKGGTVTVGDEIAILLPQKPHRALKAV